MAKAAPLLPIGSDSPDSRPRLGPAPIEMLTADRLFPSPLNPRRTPAPPEKDRELRDSIVEKGLLQPIVARPVTARTPASFEIICGARRHKMISAAIADQLLPATYLIPTVIREASDEDLIVLAAIENLERDDMAPLDEAELYKTLRQYVKPAKGERAEALIAKKVHVSERTVFRRLALLRLAPEGQEALRTGKLQLQEAAALSLGEPKAQKRALETYVRDDDEEEPGPRRSHAEDIRREMTRSKIALRFAAFDPDLYKGERIVDPDSGDIWAVDVKEFEKLQKQAAAERVETLKKKWPWVRAIADGDEWQYREEPKDEEAGAVVWIDRWRHSLCVKEGVISPEIAQKRASAMQKANAERATKAARGGAATEKRALTDGQSVVVKHAKTRAMRLGIAASPRVGLALGCLSLLEPDGEINIRVESGWHQRRDENSIAASKEEAELLAERCEGAGVKPTRSRDYAHAPSERQAAAFAKLLKLKTEKLLELYASLIATRVGDWFDNADHRIGCSPLTIAVAKAVDAETLLATQWKPTEEYFAAHGRDALERLARGLTGAQLHAAGLHGGPDQIPRMKKGELVKLLAKQPPGTWTPDKFIECRFLTDADMKKAFAEGAPAAKPKAAKSVPGKKPKAAKPKTSAKAKPAKKPARKAA